MTTFLTRLCCLAATVLVLLAGVGRPAAAAPPATPRYDGIVVKVDLAGGHTIAEVTASFPVRVDSTVLASRGIYRVRPTQLPATNADKYTAQLAAKIAKHGGVVYSEPNLRVELDDSRFHAWPFGSPGSPAGDAPVFTGQPVVARLDLASAHRRSQGAGVLVAVLDTGVDHHHPVLASRLTSGWDYVDDDANPDEASAEQAQTAVGHGTFISGLIGLTAPQARIRPARVLDAQGVGNVFVVADAIHDATAAGASVINLSFGTAERFKSRVLDDVLKEARGRGVMVVGAAGNDSTTTPHYPAGFSHVLSVAPLRADGAALTPFAARGTWVDVATYGEQLVGPAPGGGYATWSGASMSTGLVSGQAALLRAADTKAGPEQTAKAIEQTTLPLPKGSVRWGAVDIPASLER